MIDLHIHSTFSDGSLTPAQLVERAVNLGLSAIALTDHDTTRGNGLLAEACAGRPLRGIAGVEVSVEYSAGTMHMLGYFIRSGAAELEDALAQVRGGRDDRNVRILECLNKLGIPLTMDEVKARAGEDVVGRPHFAQAMLAKGHVKSVREAFDRFLAKGKPAYCDRYRLEAAAAIELIRGAGGVAVLAHPSTLRVSADHLRRLVLGLKEAGLQGLEARYSEHTREQEAAYLALAAEMGLVATGGSDFHGAVTPALEMGLGFGSLKVPDEVVDELASRAGSN